MIYRPYSTHQGTVIEVKREPYTVILVVHDDQLNRPITYRKNSETRLVVGVN